MSAGSRHSSTANLGGGFFMVQCHTMVRKKHVFVVLIIKYCGDVIFLEPII